MCFFFLIRSYSARSDLINKSARLSGLTTNGSAEKKKLCLFPVLGNCGANKNMLGKCMLFFGVFFKFARAKCSLAVIPLAVFQFFRKAPDTFKRLRHVMRAILSVRPKCSHRCVSLKESPLRPVLIFKHATKISSEQMPMRMKWFKHIAI